jgi:hypothetical protein
VGPGALAAGPSGGGQLGDPLLAGGGLGLQQGLGVLQPGQPLSPAGQRTRQYITAGAAMLLLGPIRLGGLLEHLRDLCFELGVSALGRRGGVGLDLGAIQGDQPQAHHPSRSAQLQRLNQEAGQRLLVADPEPRDGHMVGPAVAGQDPEGNVLLQAPLDLPRGADPGAVGIQQHPNSIRGSYAARPCPSARYALRNGPRSSWSTTSSTNQARWSAGSQSRRSGGSRNAWSRSQARKL